MPTPEPERVRAREVSAFRRIAAVAWPRPREPTIHGFMEVEMSAALAYLDLLRARGPGRPTVTHLVVRALARALAIYPDANAHVRFGKVRPFPSIDIFVQVNLDEGRDLSGALLRNADAMGVIEIETELRARAEALRVRQEDPLFARSRGMARRLPPLVLRWALRIAEFLSNGLALDMPWLGVPRRPFGSAMVTSVGMLGIEIGFPPFFPLADSPVLLCVGRIAQRPVAIGSRVEVRPTCYLGAAIDHRVLDGALIGKVAGCVREYLSDPAKFDPLT